MSTIAFGAIDKNTFYKIPVRAHYGDAGWDVFASELKVIPSGEGMTIKTNVFMVMPETLFCRVSLRSGLATRDHINVHAGIIDSGYRGEIMVVLFNHGKHEFYIKPGDRIAQLVFSYLPDITVIEIGSKIGYTSTTRDDRGFGSTGKN